MGEKKDYSNIITKKDLEDYRRRVIDSLKNVQIDSANLQKLIQLTDERIAEMKDEVDKAVDEVINDAKSN